MQIQAQVDTYRTGIPPTNVNNSSHTFQAPTIDYKPARMYLYCIIIRLTTGWYEVYGAAPLLSSDPLVSACFVQVPG